MADWLAIARFNTLIQNFRRRFVINHQSRPEFAVEAGPGQESVWDYPRPPAIWSCSKLVEVRFGETEIARTSQSYRVLETASPPTYYLPPDDVAWDQLVQTPGSSVCEWKGVASYWALIGDADNPVSWSYARPRPNFSKLKDYVSFYPGRVACFVAGERVRPQAGRFYGGWITDDVVGPFKGDPGTGHW